MVKMKMMKIQLIVLYVNQQLNTFAQFVRKRFVWFSAVNRIQIPLISSVEYTKPMIQDVPLWNLNVIYVKKMRRACLIVIWLTTVKLHIRMCLRYRKLMTAHGNMYLVTDVKKFLKTKPTYCFTKKHAIFFLVVNVLVSVLIY